MCWQIKGASMAPFIKPNTNLAITGTAIGRSVA